MNRQQRRNAAKNNAANFRKAAHATDASILKHMTEFEDETRTATQNHFMGLMYCVFILVLRKVCNYGPQRTLRALAEAAAIINDLSDGTITVFDLKRDAEATGIQIIFDVNYDIIECGIFEEEQYAGVRQKVDAERLAWLQKKTTPGLRLWTDPEFEAVMKGGV